MLIECPKAVIKFQLYSRKSDKTYEDRRLNRVKTKNTIPLGPWARKLVEHNRTQAFILFLIVANSVVLGIEAGTKSPHWGVKLALKVFDRLSLIVFTFEILLKWVDNFVLFWRNGWNNFDFIVTVMSVVTEVMEISSHGTSFENVAKYMRIFRVLRSLKMVSRFAQLRIIVLTIIKASKSITCIVSLLVLSMYLYGVMGTVVFGGRLERFSDLGEAIITLLQLFTKDNWYKVMNCMIANVTDVKAPMNCMIVNVTDVKAPANGTTNSEVTGNESDGVNWYEYGIRFYVISWTILGALFFNIFAGIMVMNFQNIRADFINQYKEKENEMNEAVVAKQLESDLAAHYNQHSNARRSSAGFGLQDPRVSIDGAPDKEGEPSPPKQESEDNIEVAEELKKAGTTKDWNATVKANINNFTSNAKEVLWPRDTLFRYFRLMEALQENLAERQQLQRLAVIALNNMHDSPPS